MFWVVAIMILIVILQAPSLLKNKMYRELWSFGFFWLLAFIYAGLVALKVSLPTVLETLTFLYSLF